MVFTDTASYSTSSSACSGCWATSSRRGSPTSPTQVVAGHLARRAGRLRAPERPRPAPVLARCAPTGATCSHRRVADPRPGPRATTCSGCSAGTGTLPPRRRLRAYGRIFKTLHLLAFVDPADEGYPRTPSTGSSPSRSPATGCRAQRTPASAANSARPTAKARKISSARSAWSLTPSCCGTPATPTPPSPSSTTPGAATSIDADAARLSPLVRLPREHARPLRLYAAARREGLRPLRDPASPDYQ